MQNHYRFDRFEVRPARRELLIAGEPVALGARAFDLLLCLIERRDRLVAKSEVLDLVWPGLVVEENNLSVQVSVLRKLLGPQAITTVAGRGYRFALQVEEAVSGVVEEPVAQRLMTSKPTIVVLPFQVRSDDRHLVLLADGLAEDVIALLARVPGFTLISHASSFMFRDRQDPAPEIARQLDVRYVVEGSVRPSGETLRVSTRLTDAALGHVLWSGQFDSPRAGAVDLQDDIVRGILSKLEPELIRAENAHIRRQRPENLDAWAHYQQAVGAIALKGWNEDAVAEARAQLQRSVTLDPVFGLGHAQYALYTALARNIGLLPDVPSMESEVLDSAHRAMALDDGSSKVLGYVGCALCDIGQHDRGMEILRRALEMDPSNAQAHVGLGASLALTGRFEAGISRMRVGMRLSPCDRRLGFWNWALGAFLFRTERCGEALQEARSASRNDPKLHLARILEAAALDQLGRQTEARVALAQARQLRPRLSLNEIVLTHGRHVGERMALLWKD